MQCIQRQSSTSLTRHYAAGNSSDVEGQPQENTRLNTFVQNLTNPAANTLTQFQVAAQIAKTCVASTNVGLITNSGWTYHPNAGRYTTANGTSYLLRARE